MNTLYRGEILDYSQPMHWLERYFPFSHHHRILYIGAQASTSFNLQATRLAMLPKQVRHFVRLSSLLTVKHIFRPALTIRPPTFQDTSIPKNSTLPRQKGFQS